MGSDARQSRSAATGFRAARRLRREVADTARLIHERGLVAGSAGNVSARLGDDILITPTRVRYEALGRRQIVRVGLGAPDAAAGASRELPLHLAIYREHPDVGAVIHTHSPYATAFSFTGGRLQPEIEDIAYLGIGEIRIALPAPAASEELGSGAVETMGDSRAVLLANHGVVAVGATVAEALSVAEAVEHQAIVAWLAAAPRGAERRAPGFGDVRNFSVAGQRKSYVRRG